VIAIVLSQYLIIGTWEDAKYGTITNIILLVSVAAAIGSWRFSRQYHEGVDAYKTAAVPQAAGLLTEADIQSLPAPVQAYIRFSGSIGKSKVRNFRVRFQGHIRKDEASVWMPFTSEQYNFVDEAVRLFYMKAKMFSLPVSGFHSFRNGHAFMDIRLMSLFRVEYQSGPEMDIAETVTFFNDMCCMAPACLIDKRIQWQEVEEGRAKATFTNNNITVSAWLYFNEKGALVDFVSDDRYALGSDHTMSQVPWSTPISEYHDFNGYYLGNSASTIYTYPGRKLCYGNFNLIDIAYNCA
jgi:hypothetical protein